MYILAFADIVDVAVKLENVNKLLDELEVDLKEKNLLPPSEFGNCDHGIQRVLMSLQSEMLRW